MGDTIVRPPARNTKRTSQRAEVYTATERKGDRLNDRPTRTERLRRRGDTESARPNDHCNRRTIVRTEQRRPLRRGQTKQQGIATWA